MRITVDTNLLVRAVVQDDLRQARIAAKLLREAEQIAVTLPCLCELVWVLRRVYRFKQQEILDALEALLQTKNVSVNRGAAEAGLRVFRAGGDFADGLIAYEGQWLGGEIFVSFDEEAVSLLRAQQISARSAIE